MAGIPAEIEKMKHAVLITIQGGLLDLVATLGDVEVHVVDFDCHDQQTGSEAHITRKTYSGPEFSKWVKEQVDDLPESRDEDNDEEPGYWPARNPYGPIEPIDVSRC